MKKKRQFRNIFQIMLLWFTYPRQLADAINRAANWDDLEETLGG